MRPLPDSWSDEFGLIRRLSPAHADCASAVAERLRRERRWAKFVSLPYLLANWPRVVESLANYHEMKEEYQNDLDTRNILQDIIDELPQPIAANIEELLKPWDERFRTETIESPGLWRRPGGKPGWWNERSPASKRPLW